MPSAKNKIPMAITAAILGWVIPGGGYLVLKDYKRAAIIFVVITSMFAAGLYAASFAAVDIVHAKAWYYAQIFFSPIVEVIARYTASQDMVVYGRAADIGQLYTSLAGILNLVCILKSAAIAMHGEDAYKEGDK